MSFATNSTVTTATTDTTSQRKESPYQQRTNPKDNPAQQVIKQAVDYLIEQLEQGKSEALTAYLTAMARFHTYSFANSLLIFRQRPMASRVAGFHKWTEFGRHVRKGEKGIQIFAPMMGRRRSEDASKADAREEKKLLLIGFRAVYVFDVEQTEGADLPEMNHSVTGEVGEQLDRLIDFVRQQNITLEYNEHIAPALGVSYGGKIALLPGQSKAETFSSLVHELAHELMHRTERHIQTTKTVRETEAEAVAFVVGKAAGLDDGNFASDYIQLYHGNAELLAESLEIVQRTASVILAAIQPEATQQPAPKPEQTHYSEFAEVAA